jgi:hypothetical protein
MIKHKARKQTMLANAIIEYYLHARSLMIFELEDTISDIKFDESNDINTYILFLCGYNVDFNYPNKSSISKYRPFMEIVDNETRRII